MKVRSSNTKRVYVTATDSRTKRSKGMTIEGLTPTQFIRFVRDAVKLRSADQLSSHAAAGRSGVGVHAGLQSPMSET
jgi:hypothetical protein